MLSVFMILVTTVVSGCSSLRYSQHIDRELEKGKIDSGSTFIVFPVHDVTFNVPNSIFYTYSAKDKIRIEQLWNSEIQKNAREIMPDTNFKFISSNDSLLFEEESSIFTMKHIAYESSHVRIFDPRNRDEKKKEYFQKKVNHDMKCKLQPYLNEYNADYAIIFINPYLHFTERDFRNESVPTVSQYFGYTSTIEFQIWDLSEGTLVFDSGAYNHSFFFKISTLILRDKLTIEKNAKQVIKVLDDFLSIR